MLWLKRHAACGGLLLAAHFVAIGGVAIGRRGLGPGGEGRRGAGTVQVLPAKATKIRNDDKVSTRSEERLCARN